MGSPRLRARAIFISDLHLGSAACDSKAVEAFLQRIDCDYLYLVGDIMDMWVSRKQGKWLQIHTNVVRLILDLAEHGTKVYLTPGNHDSEFRRLNGVDFGNVSVGHEFVHETLDGRRFWVIHGDYLDRSVTKFQWLAKLGARLHESMTVLNNAMNKARAKVGKPPSEFASKGKTKVKNMIRYFNNFEDRITVDAKYRHYDGVICGHVHRPDFHVDDDTRVLYINTGDWMKFNTFLMEADSGELTLFSWNEGEPKVWTPEAPS